MSKLPVEARRARAAQARCRAEVEALDAAGRERRRAEAERLKSSKNLGKAIRRARAAGMTQSEIAEAAGVSRMTVHNLTR